MCPFDPTRAAALQPPYASAPYAAARALHFWPRVCWPAAHPPHARPTLKGLHVTLEPLATADADALHAAIPADDDGIISSRVRPDGRPRESAVHSIIDREWPAIRDGLDARIQAMGVQPRA